MKTHPIRRQHDDTSLPELVGACCTAFRAVTRRRDQRFGPLYLQLSGVWHRFYLDAGLLFWEEGPGPDPEDDLLEGERYTDLAEALHAAGAAIREVEMHDCQLTLRFENGGRLVLRNQVEDDGAEMVDFVPGR